jgi:GAF domain-containing protein/HAMP domain-containing protein
MRKRATLPIPTKNFRIIVLEKKMNDMKTPAQKKNIWQGKTPSLRLKILFGIFFIVLLTVAAMGIFVFNRSQSTNDFLVDQISVSVNQEIENRLAATVSREANKIHLFFESKKNAIELFGNTTETFITKDKSIILAESNWNPLATLYQLPNGNWDNDNSEPSSIFIPARPEIPTDLARELVALKGLDDLALSLLEENPDIIAIYYGGQQGETAYYPNIDLAAILPPDFDVTSRPWYTGAVDSPEMDRKAVWSSPYQDAALNGLVITSSIPVYDERSEFRGAVAIDILLNTVTQQVSSISIGRTGYGLLIDRKGRVIAMPDKGYVDFNLTEEEIQSGDIEDLSLINRVPLDVFEVLAKMTSGQTGVRQVTINDVTRYIAYQPIPVVGYSLGIIISEDEVLEDFIGTTRVVEEKTQSTLLSTLGVSVFLLALAGLAAFGIGNSITAPLGRLTKTAKEVAGGNLDIRAEENTNDEIGLLASTLNNVTSTAQELIATLEQRVVERTNFIEKRATQFQAVAEVGKAVTTQRDLGSLLTSTAHLISDRFDFYHVGIFLIDPHKEYAILRASNSSGGKRMLDRDHRLKVGAEGIVGTAAGTGEARIALDVGEDAVYFDNPDLPQTRSEMALPLIAGGETLGILDIQSLEANAFSDEDIPTLQLLADQLAVAVENSNLLNETQEALMLARRATEDVSKRGWKSLQKADGLGFISQMHSEVKPVSSNLDLNIKGTVLKGESLLSTDNRTLTMPVSVRGQTIAMMRLVKPFESEPWTPDEIVDVEALANQISNALESARLYTEAQRRAARERAIGDISTSISTASEMDGILRTAVEQLGQKLGGAEVVLEMGNKVIGAQELS